MELDAARARVERGRLSSSAEALAGLAAAERHDAAAACRRGRQHLGVGLGVAAAARRLERERARARDVAGIHRLEQRGEVEARAVGRILAQMGVHVDEPALRRHERAHVRAPDPLERCGGVCEFGWHGAAS